MIARIFLLAHLVAMAVAFTIKIGDTGGCTAITWQSAWIAISLVAFSASLGAAAALEWAFEENE